VQTTIRHIAKEAGVSVGTVSNVLNNPDGVAEETRQRVLDVISRHNYRPNSIARSLKTRRPRTYGLIVSSIFNPFSAAIIEGATEASHELGCSLILANAEYDGSDVPQHVTTLADQWVDGIFLAAQQPADGALNEAHFQDVPVVIMDHGQSPLKNAVGQIGFDWKSAGYQATHHLIELGHRNIGFVGGIAGRPSSILRQEGYLMALREAGIPAPAALQVAGDFLTESGYRCAKQLLSLAQRPTALLMGNDLMALGAYQAASELGLRIPDDLSVAGIDDNFFSAFLSPPLTTVHVPTRELGRIGLHMLAENPDRSGDLQRLVIPTALVVRGSTRTIRYLDHHQDYSLNANASVMAP
jgi:DNA-binding LacI/PurR family transcriptional regulator